MHTLEEFARISALLRQGGGAARRELLASVGLDAASFEELERHWDAIVEIEVASGGGAR